MKAEHRKELETNVLADRMGKLVETARANPKASFRFWIVVTLVLAAIVLGYYLYQSSSTDTSRLWIQLDAAKNAEELEKFAGENGGTIPARTARFEAARILLAQGVQNLGSPEQHASALGKLEKARALYEELSNEGREMPLLAQEAMMGAAKAEESLCGSAKPDHANEPRGTLDRALELYQKLADAQPETFQTKAAREKVQELQDPAKRAKLLEFYVKLNQQVEKKP